MSKELKTQWHPAFVSAMKLELLDDAEYLDYTSEYNLNTKPLEMDLLIVKKDKDVEIKNEIGKIFRKHNIIEYKSPDDSMNLNTYMKVLAYACLYKAYENYVDEIPLDQITITMKENKQIFGKLKEEEKMCQALREFFEPELKEAIKGAEENNRKDMILNALKVGSSAEDISRVMGIPLTEVETIAKGI